METAHASADDPPCLSRGQLASVLAAGSSKHAGGFLGTLVSKLKSAPNPQRERMYSGSSQDGSGEELSEGDRPEDFVASTSATSAPREGDAYGRLLALRQQEQEEKERQLAEREAYREQRRLAAKQGPKEEAHRRRVQLWLQMYFTACPLWALKRLALVQQSRETLARLFVPLYRFRRHQRRRTEVLWRTRKELLAVMRPPTLEMLTQREFFKKWPEDSLRKMCYKLQPVKFKAGEYIMLDGDPGNEMYFLESGKVDIIIRSKGPSKKRGRANGIVVATLGPGAHFGEFALLNDEPRMASIQCVEDCTCWTLGKAEFRAEVFSRSKTDPLRTSMAESANSRRKMNMRKLYPLTRRQLTALPEFAGWAADQLDHIAAQVQPVVARSEDVIFQEGASTDCAYIVATGTLQVWQRTAWWRAVSAMAAGGVDGGAAARGEREGRTWDAELGQLIAVVGPGDIFGEIGCMYLEPQPYTVRATTNADLWQLPRQQWKEAMLSDVSRFLQARAVVNKKRAAWLEQLPAKCLADCPALREALGSRLAASLPALRDLLEPHVAGDGDVVTNSGTLYLVSGQLESRKHLCKVAPGTWVGGETFLDPTAAEDELKSSGKSEMWVLPLLAFRKFTLSQEQEAMGAIERPQTVPVGPKPTLGGGALSSVAKPESPTKFILCGGSSQYPPTLLRGPSQYPTTMPEPAVACGSPVRSARLLTDRSQGFASITSTSLTQESPATIASSPSVPSFGGNQNLLELCARKSPTELLDTPRSQSRSEVRSPRTPAKPTSMKFVAGFIPPGFSQSSEAVKEAEERRRQQAKPPERKARCQVETPRGLSRDGRQHSTLPSEPSFAGSLHGSLNGGLDDATSSSPSSTVRGRCKTSPFPRSDTSASVIRRRFPSSSPTLGSSRPPQVETLGFTDLEGLPRTEATLSPSSSTGFHTVSPSSSAGCKTPSAKGGYVQALQRDRERATTLLDLQLFTDLPGRPDESPQALRPSERSKTVADLQRTSAPSFSPTDAKKAFHLAFARHL